MVAKVGFGIKKDFLFCLQLVCIIMEIYPVAKKKSDDDTKERGDSH